MEFNIYTDVVRKTTDEELCFLQGSESTRVRRARLERLHVVVDGGCEGQPGQIGQVVGAEGRPEPLLA